MKYIPHPFRKERKCKRCQTSFITRINNHYYCDNCRNSELKTGTEKLPTGTTGAISELLVSADLLKKGYEVFRAVSANCSCDLAILKDNKLKRIEVRTGRRLRNGIIHASDPNIRADILAIVIHNENLIVYRPEL